MVRPRSFTPGKIVYRLTLNCGSCDFPDVVTVEQKDNRILLTLPADFASSVPKERAGVPAPNPADTGGKDD